MYKSFVKRVLDLGCATLAFLLLLPIFLLVTIASYVAHNGGVFFTQKRPGLHEKIFTLYKFKSMNDKRDEKGNLLPNEDRLTSFGKFIRKTSLDEIPQLINVLKGDMSLIGPRPLRVSYLEHYSSEQRKRHSVKPGITGWAQINGRNQLTWAERFELDVWYTRKMSFLLDCKILFLTLLKVLKVDGINADGLDNNKPFDGSN